MTGYSEFCFEIHILRCHLMSHHCLQLPKLFFLDSPSESSISRFLCAYSLAGSHKTLQMIATGSLCGSQAQWGGPSSPATCMPAGTLCWLSASRALWNWSAPQFLAQHSPLTHYRRRCNIRMFKCVLLLLLLLLQILWSPSCGWFRSRQAKPDYVTMSTLQSLHRSWFRTRKAKPDNRTAVALVKNLVAAGLGAGKHHQMMVLMSTLAVAGLGAENQKRGFWVCTTIWTLMYQRFKGFKD